MNSLQAGLFNLVIFTISVYLVCRYVLPFIAKWHEERNSRPIRDSILFELKDLNGNLKDVSTNLKAVLDRLNGTNGQSY